MKEEIVNKILKIKNELSSVEDEIRNEGQLKRITDNKDDNKYKIIESEYKILHEKYTKKCDEYLRDKNDYVNYGKNIVKGYLSYRLGKIVVDNGFCITGILRTPFNLLSEYRKWKKEKEQGILISVVVPMYNCEKYIEKCMRSVLEQKVKNIELICVDDGSTDNTLKISKKIAELDNRVIILEQKNLHAGCARNAGLNAAKGTYVHFLDSDDWVENNIYTTCAKLLSTNADVCFFSYNNYDNITGDKKPSKYFEDLKAEFINKKRNDITDILMRGPVVPWNKIYKRSFLVINDIKFDNLTVANDRSFFFNLLKGRPSVIITKDRLLNYRTNNKNSLVGLKRLSNFDCHFKSFDLVKYLFEGNERDIVIDLFIKDLMYFYERAVKTENDNIRLKIENQIKKYFGENELYFSCIDRLSGKKSYDFFLKMKREVEIPIVFSVDDAYVKYLMVTIKSMIDNMSVRHRYEIVILYSSLTEDNKNLLRTLIVSGVNIRFYNVNYLIKSKSLYERAHYSISMYYRILIPEIMKNYNKVLYLDSDLLIVDDVSKLYFENIDEYYVAACSNLVNKSMRKYTNWKFKIDYPEYFNSGVLLINAKKWKEDKIAEKCFNYLSKYKDLVCPDQDALNVVCHGKVKYINMRWNFAWQHLVLKSDLDLIQLEEFEKANKNEKSIIHFTSGVKPWKRLEWKNEYGQQWWNCARKLNIYDSLIFEARNNKTKFDLSDRA